MVGWWGGGGGGGGVGGIKKKSQDEINYSIFTYIKIIYCVIMQFIKKLSTR